MNREPTRRDISLLLALLPLLMMVALVVVGHMMYDIDLRFILLVSAVISGITAYISGVSVKEMFEAYSTTIKEAFPIILILIAIGGIVGSWMYSGTVPYLIYYGLKFLNHDFVLVSAFLVTAMVSTFTGTSWGSAATAGVAFMGIGASMGIPLPMVAGAALSGAFFGDKISPVSDTTNLCALSSGVTVYKHIRGMLPNVLIAGFLAAIGFVLLGIFYTGTPSETTEVQSIIDNLDGIYNLNIVMLLPAAVVFIGGYKGYHPVILMVCSSLIAVLIGALSNGFAINDGAQAMISGFNLEMIENNGVELNQIPEILTELLDDRGGFEGMIKGAVLFCILAIAFGSFMEVSGAFGKLMRLLLSVVRSVFGLIVSAFMAGGLLNGVSGNAAFSIITIGQLFKPHFKQKSIPLTVLARSMENSMTLLESMLPWHVTAIYMAATLGVAALDYIPFALFNIAGIILFFILSWLGVKRSWKR
jgi:NhaC family Na+:H+ antiporter